MPFLLLVVTLLFRSMGLLGESLGKERLLTLSEVADYIGVPLQTLYGWRSRGEGPRGVRCGKHVRVRRADLDAWLEQHADPAPAA